jgi:cell wall-associated NlpC family hydrolase
MVFETRLVCREGIAPVRAEPDPRSERLTDLLFGEEFVVVSEHEGFAHEGLAFGKTAMDAVEGFVPGAVLAPQTGAPTHRVRRIFVQLFDAPELVKANGKILPMNALVETTGRAAPVRYPSGSPGSTALELRGGDWVIERGLVPRDGFETDVHAVAAMFVGAAYLHGGKTWLGCDGPGLIQTVLAACGLHVPRRMAEQIAFFGGDTSVPRDGRTPFSLLYHGDACGFGFDDGEVIAASRDAGTVIRTSEKDFFRAAPQRRFRVP